jgi:predicted transposase/invertase (TIGR01784 family)
MTELTYPLKYDIAFKYTMLKHRELLKSLVASVLSVDERSIEQIVVTNPELTPEHVEGKHCRLDLNLVVDDDIVDVEIQLRDEGNYKERSVYYLACLHAGTLNKGQDYREVPRSILVNILDFNLFECDGPHSEFALLERSRTELLSDIMTMHFFELRKFKGAPDRSDLLGLWMRLISARFTEELDEIDDLGVDVMSKAAEAIRQMQQDKALRHLALRREMAEHDEAQALGNAECRGIEIGEQRGRAEIIQQLQANGFDAARIAKVTGYSEQQVLSLLKTTQQ